MKRLSLFLPMLCLLGCERTPSIDLQGSFLPSWMLCLLAGFLIAVFAYRVILRQGWEERIAPAVLFYPSLVVAASSLVWLIFFR